jgi:hypothetical protein
MSDIRFTLDNSLYIRHILTESFRVVMQHPMLKSDFLKVIEGAAVLGTWYEEYKLAAPQIVQDIINKPKREWMGTWCRPDNWKRWDQIKKQVCN